MYRKPLTVLIGAFLLGTLLFTPPSSIAARSTKPAAPATGSDWTTYLGDSSHSGFNGSETIINPTSARTLKILWQYKAPDFISAQPIVTNGLIYWGSYDGYEHASNLSGGLVWSAFLGQTVPQGCWPPRGGVASAPTVISVAINGTLKSVVLVGGGDANFYALDAMTGAIIWKTPLGTPPATFLWSSPAVNNGSVYEGVSSFGDCPLVQGQLVQMDVATGAIQHVFKVVADGCTGGGVWSSPTIDAARNTVYFSTGTINTCKQAYEKYAIGLVAVSATNLSFIDSWQVPAQQRISDGDFGATPTLFSATINGVFHPMVGLLNKNGTYYAFDRNHRGVGPLWQDAMSGSGPQDSFASSAWDGTTLYAAGSSTVINGVACAGSIRALDPATGAYLWQVCLPYWAVAPVTVVPGVVVVEAGGKLFALDASSGAQLFRYGDGNLGSWFWGPASIANGVLYEGNKDGYLYAFAPSGS